MARKKVDPLALRGEFTLEEWRHEARYDLNTGLFWWLIPRQGRRPGRPAGGIAVIHGRRCITIGFGYRKYYAHVLAWFWVTGIWPDDEIDHVNEDATDNRWSNLRQANHSQNSQNRLPSRKNPTGLVGAQYDKRRKLWCARLRRKHLGYFKTAEEAHEAYKRAALEAYGEFAHRTLR